MNKAILAYTVFFLSLLVISPSTLACGPGCVIQSDGSCVCPKPKPQP